MIHTVAATPCRPTLEPTELIHGALVIEQAQPFRIYERKRVEVNLRAVELAMAIRNALT